MPELPEVETIRLGLQRYIVGKTIEGVEIRLKKILSGDTKNIIGAKIIGVRRFGKGLAIDLDNGYSIAIHIKLTGQLIYRGPEVPDNLHQSIKVGGELPNKFTHVIFKLKSQSSNLKTTSQISKLKYGGNAYLYYNDVRQFGWIRIVESGKLKDESFFRDLGPEPLPSSGQAALTFEMFKDIVLKSALAIKVLIMDQKKIGGIGNIYANDALFDAAIDPRRKAKSLKQEEIKKLFASILKVLKIGLENGGASELNYVNALGQEGKYQHHFLVYGKENEPCKVCGSKIIKIKLSGRGTYFCPKCQK